MDSTQFFIQQRQRRRESELQSARSLVLAARSSAQLQRAVNDYSRNDPYLRGMALNRASENQLKHSIEQRFLELMTKAREVFLTQIEDLPDEEKAAKVRLAYASYQREWGFMAHLPSRHFHAEGNKLRDLVKS